jgi:hypothetical protein
MTAGVLMTAILLPQWPLLLGVVQGESVDQSNLQQEAMHLYFLRSTSCADGSELS